MSMIIRPANAADTPFIIELLKKSLGESTIPKSEALWNWKHADNPFGASEILIAEDNDTLVGIRAFMHWQWLWKGKTYRAVRAVDTATHPDFQGKGIFKNLTLQLAGHCKRNGIHFIFNTPNKQSLPGYLKMGWVEQGKLPIKFRPLRPFSLGYAMAFDKKKYAGISGDPTPNQSWDDQIIQLAASASIEHNRLTTPLTPAYLSWRYASNPLFRYHYFTDHQNFLLITRIKQQSFTRELRIVECLQIQGGASTVATGSYLKKEVLRFCKKHAVDIVSLSGEQFRAKKDLFSWMGPLPILPAGPVVTLKDLNMNEDFSQLLAPANWAYSLGDLELF